MDNLGLFEFLNMQTPDTLFWYAVFALVALGMITNMFIGIAKAFRKPKIKKEDVE